MECGKCWNSFMDFQRRVADDKWIKIINYGKGSYGSNTNESPFVVNMKMVVRDKSYCVRACSEAVTIKICKQVQHWKPGERRMSGRPRKSQQSGINEVIRHEKKSIG